MDSKDFLALFLVEQHVVSMKKKKCKSLIRFNCQTEKHFFKVIVCNEHL